MCWMKGVNYTAGDMADFWLIMSSLFNSFIFVWIIKVIRTNRMAWSKCRLITNQVQVEVPHRGRHCLSNDDFREGMQIYSFVLCSTICFNWPFIVIIREKRVACPLFWTIASVIMDWCMCLKIIYIYIKEVISSLTVLHSQSLQNLVQHRNLCATISP